MKEDKDLIIKWINYAKAGLAAAIELFSENQILYKIVCYHCQQSAEKIMKAYMLALDVEITKTHNLEKLNSIIQNYDSTIYHSTIFLNELSRYASTTRYPDDFEDIDKQEAEEAIMKSKDVLTFFEEKIKLKLN
jgi:HEPN domain-containing protein